MQYWKGKLFLFARKTISLCLLVLDHVDELRLHELTVKVGDGVLERVLEALAALAFVPASLEAATQDGDALKNNLNLMKILPR